MTTNNEHTQAALGDRYQRLRKELPGVIADAKRQGGVNERAELVAELLAERDALAAAPGARHATPEGWRLVPEKPSIEMCIQGAAATDGAINGHAAGQVYAAMLLIAERPDVPDAQAMAWMNPETMDVIHADRKHEWETHFGAGGAKKAKDYTVPLILAAPAHGVAPTDALEALWWTAGALTASSMKEADTIRADGLTKTVAEILDMANAALAASTRGDAS